jgi:3-oxoacyl-[acyl-carrier protein] reductase
MSLRLKDQVALITGASRGIGRASAIALAAEGAKIVGVARTKAELDTLVAQITASGGAAIAVVADVTKSADVARSVQEAIAAFGRVDILVNNVGMGGYRPFLEWSEEDYDRIMATNAKSSWLYAREIIPVMRKNGASGGQIINVSSVAGLQAYPNEIIYCMSKAAQQALTQGLDREFFRENIK